MSSQIGSLPSPTLSSTKPGRQAARLLGNTLMFLVTAIFLASGSAKLAQLPPVVAEMTTLHLAGWKLALVGSLEISTGLLFILPCTRSLGLLVMSAYLGAAMCAHLEFDQHGGIVVAAAFLACCWIGTALRHPHVLWSFRAPMGPSAR